MAAAATVVSRESLEGLISDYESALLAMCQGELPDEWAANLASIDRASVFGLLKYWKWLAIYSELRNRERQGESQPVDPIEAQGAARQLLRREPVTVEIGPHVAKVTARSYSCMVEIARHDRRIRLLSADLAYLDRTIRSRADELSAVEQARRAKLRRDLRRYSEIAGRIEVEITQQRAALWAHAFTPSGAPARDTSHLPQWWIEIDPIWDTALLMGLMEAGAGRYRKLGRTPEPARTSERKGEDFGWSTLLASVERQHRLEPASLFDRDLFQTLTWLRAGAEPVPEELIHG